MRYMYVGYVTKSADEMKDIRLWLESIGAVSDDRTDDPDDRSSARIRVKLYGNALLYRQWYTVSSLSYVSGEDEIDVNIFKLKVLKMLKRIK